MPSRTPVATVGHELATTARAAGRALDERLCAAGGSRPTWLVLQALDGGRTRNQRELAAAVGIRGATLTHHLNAMESDGLVTRRRDPRNRRVHLVETTAAGARRYEQLARIAAEHDSVLRAGLDDGDLDRLHELLGRVRANLDPVRHDDLSTSQVL